MFFPRAVWTEQLLTPTRSKRTGLEKALHQVEQALRRSRSGVEAAKVVSDLKALLGPAANGLLPAAGPAGPAGPGQSAPSSGAEPRRASRQSDILLPDASSDAGNSSASDQDAASVPHGSTPPSQGHAAEESLAVDDAENPLQLLARASDLHVSPKAGADAISHQRTHQSRQTEKFSEVERFFKLSQFSLDTGPDLDPVDLGLITLEEADALFNL